jgi:hypothetical protein
VYLNFVKVKRKSTPSELKITKIKMTSTPSELKISRKLAKSTLSEPINIDYKNKFKKILYKYT